METEPSLSEASAVMLIDAGEVKFALAEGLVRETTGAILGFTTETVTTDNELTIPSLSVARALKV